MASFYHYSNLCALLAFGALALYLCLPSKSVDGNVPRHFLAIVCLVNATWSGILAFVPLSARYLLLTEGSEYLRDLMWGWYIIRVIYFCTDRTFAHHKKIIIALLVFTAFAILSIPLLHWTSLSDDPASSKPAFALHLAFSIINLILVEQIFRNTPDTYRWGIKFFCFGVGTLFALDFLMYSEALMFGSLSSTLWVSRGLIHVFAVPLILISDLRGKTWNKTLKLSRHVVFHSVTLIASGIYLLSMSVIAYSIRVEGGSWGPAAQTFLLFGASLLLLIILFSGKIRSKFKVTISKHFFNHQFDYRVEWLKFSRTLLNAENSETIYEAAISALGALVECQKGALWLQSEPDKTYHCVASMGTTLSEDTISPKSSLVRFFQEYKWVIDMDEYDPRRSPFEKLDIPPSILAMKGVWLIVPLMLHTRLTGFIVLSEPLGKIEFNWEVSDLLKAAGYQLASNLMQKQASDALMVARQFESYHRMSAFIVHDLKNLMMQLSLLTSNAEKFGDSAEFQEDMQFTLKNVVARMNQLLLRLQGNNRETQLQPVNLETLIRQVLQDKAAFKPKPQFHPLVSCTVCADGERLHRAIGNIIQNACEATPHDGQVIVRLHTEGNHAVIEIQDTGKGMDDAFIRTRLFRPFDSTKKTGMGVGVYECKAYLEELGGWVKVNSQIQVGTTFQLAIPLSSASRSA